MPRLFDVPDNTRVRFTNRLIRWVDRGKDMEFKERVTWEGLTTSYYDRMRGQKRRLIIRHTIPKWAEEGTYQSDCECEIVT